MPEHHRRWEAIVDEGRAEVGRVILVPCRQDRQPGTGAAGRGREVGHPDDYGPVVVLDDGEVSHRREG